MDSGRLFPTPASEGGKRLGVTAGDSPSIGPIGIGPSRRRVAAQAFSQSLQPVRLGSSAARLGSAGSQSQAVEGAVQLRACRLGPRRFLRHPVPLVVEPLQILLGPAKPVEEPLIGLVLGQLVFEILQCQVGTLPGEVEVGVLTAIRARLQGRWTALFAVGPTAGSRCARGRLASWIARPSGPCVFRRLRVALVICGRAALPVLRVPFAGVAAGLTVLAGAGALALVCGFAGGPVGLDLIAGVRAGGPFALLAGLRAPLFRSGVRAGGAGARLLRLLAAALLAPARAIAAGVALGIGILGTAAGRLGRLALARLALVACAGLLLALLVRLLRGWTALVLGGWLPGASLALRFLRVAAPSGFSRPWPEESSWVGPPGPLAWAPCPASGWARELGSWLAAGSLSGIRCWSPWLPPEDPASPCGGLRESG